MRGTLLMAVLVGGLLLGARLQAQATGPVARIGYLAPSPALSAVDRSRLETLRASLRQLGWVEGSNLLIETRHAGPDPQRQRALAAELKGLGVALGRGQRS